MKISTVERIHSIQNHPNPEVNRVDVAKILGWPVVIRKGEFKENELVIFIHPDTIVDNNNPYFAFLESRHYYINLSKFKKYPSAGLVCPLSVLDFYGIDKNLVVEGQEVDIKCVHYEKAPDLKDANSKGELPSCISKTDEDNLLSNLECLKEFERAWPVYITIKIDGESISFVSNNGEFDVCSRRLSKKEGDNKWWNACRKYDIQEKLKGKNLALQGELYGEGIAKNPLGIKGQDIAIFNIKDLNTGKYFGYYEIKEWCEQNGIPKVSLVGKYDICPPIETLQEIANNSKYPNSSNAEGVVIRPVTPCYSYVLQKMLSVKVLNTNY